ncbi:MAG TPA: hypothetical protein DIT58_14500 [Porticoccaceae bacterium]|nr:hypothetical protein [Porticoccaceae bacterium]
MKALAEFIMAGRLKASLVACLGNLLPFVSPAAVALVTLRKSYADAFIVTLWAVLPLVAMLKVAGDKVSEADGLMVWAALLSVLVVVLSALVLRASASWSRTLLAIIGASILLALAIKVVLAAKLEAVRGVLLEMLKQIGEQEQGISLMFSDLFLAGLLAWAMALMAVVALLLGRWWQALLYNPGGFQKEFHALRMQKGVAMALLAGLSACYLLPQDYFTWGNVLGLPLLLSGIALVHHVVTFAQLGGHWLVIFYFGLILLIGPLSTVLVGLGFLDSMLDLRARFAARKSDS